MAYTKIVFQNSPSTATPLNAKNLNHMDDQIALNDQRLTALEGAHVASFNSRTGAVTSEKGDYDIDQIVASDGQEGYIPVWRNSGTEQEPDWGFAMEEMGGSGHTIQNSAGTDLPQEDKMQFADSFVSDDSTNGRTVVENIKEVSPADYDSTTDEGIIVTDDGNDALIGAVSDDYVEVTADGVKTYQTLLKELYDEIDSDKVTNNAKLFVGNNLFSISRNIDGDYRFGECETSGNGSKIQGKAISLSATLSRNHMVVASTNSGSTEFTNYDSTVSTDGEKLTLYYGNKKATVDLQTTANRCLMSDGNPISDLECDKTSAGTYTLRATVDAQGNVTYSWV